MTIPPRTGSREPAGSRGGSRVFRHDLPRHMTDHAGVVTVSSGWYTHDHPHGHPGDQQSVNHKATFGHRHEHRWQPDERHHHAVDQPEAGGS